MEYKYLLEKLQIIVDSVPDNNRQNCCIKSVIYQLMSSIVSERVDLLAEHISSFAVNELEYLKKARSS